MGEGYLCALVPQQSNLCLYNASFYQQAPGDDAACSFFTRLRRKYDTADLEVARSAKSIEMDYIIDLDS